MESISEIRIHRPGGVARGALYGILLATMPLAGVCSSARSQTFTRLGQLPGGDTPRVQDISADGSTLVGSSGVGTFRWTWRGGLERLGVVPGASNSHATGVSADGSVIAGNIFVDNAFRWTAADGMQRITLPPGWRQVFVSDVSGDGTMVVGSAQTPDGGRGFRWTSAEGIVVLEPPEGDNVTGVYGANADGSVIVGFSGIQDETTRAVRWVAGEGLQVLGSVAGRSFTYATAVTPDGSIVVGASSGEPPRGFRWTQAQGLQEIGDMTTTGLSDDGSLVVGFAHVRAAIWRAADGVVDVVAHLTSIGLADDISGWELPTVVGVSGDGRIITGLGRNPDNQFETWIATLTPCEADINADRVVNSQDLFDFLTLFFAADPSADFNADGAVNSADFFDFLDVFFVDCP